MNPVAVVHAFQASVATVVTPFESPTVVGRTSPTTDHGKSQNHREFASATSVGIAMHLTHSVARQSLIPPSNYGKASARS